MDIEDTTMFNFALSFGDAKIIVAALGKLPMESVEPLVNSLRRQVEAQMAEKTAQNPSE